MLETYGLVFHVTTLTDAIPDGPEGVWIENSLVAQNPVLREREKNRIRFRFIAVNPVGGTAPEAPMELLHRITSQSMPGTEAFGNAMGLKLYADALPPTYAIASLIG